MSPNQRYHAMTQTILPRPIAWVLSLNEDDSFNLAPFSYFNAVSSAPPTLMLSIGARPDGRPKDTWRNIQARRDFVVHIPSVKDQLAVTASAAPLEPNESEVAQGGHKLASWEFSLPRLETCKAAFACSLAKAVEVGAQQVVFGEIHRLYVDDAIASQEGVRLNVDAAKLDPLARLGAKYYAAVNPLP